MYKKDECKKSKWNNANKVKDDIWKGLVGFERLDHLDQVDSWIPQFSEKKNISASNENWCLKWLLKGREVHQL